METPLFSTFLRMDHALFFLRYATDHILQLSLSPLFGGRGRSGSGKGGLILVLPPRRYVQPFHDIWYENNSPREFGGDSGYRLPIRLLAPVAEPGAMARQTGAP